MLDYLEKFNNLPPKIKNPISMPEIIQEINEIGKRYQIDLATTVMKVMVKEIDIRNLANYFINNFGFNQARAQHLENELKDKIFAEVINYLYRKESIQSIDNGGVHLTNSEDDYWDNKIDYIIERSGLTLGSDTLKNRLSNILLTYLKHVRNKLTTRDALTKSFETGGLGLDKESADNILLLADDKIKENEKIEIRQPARISVPEDIQSLSQEANYDLAKSLANKKKLEQEHNQSNTQVLNKELNQELNQTDKNILLAKDVKAIAPPPPVISQQKSAFKKQSLTSNIKQNANSISDQSVSAKPVVESRSVSTTESTIKSRSQQHKPINNLQKTKSGKIKMDDIKSAPKVFTPIDELRYMTLRNFRNLDKDPFKAIIKIKEKLEVLKSDDYGKMVAGTKAWKISPVNRLYLKVYNQGLKEGKSVQDIFEETKTDQSALTEQEFEAIIKLNKELKF